MAVLIKQSSTQHPLLFFLTSSTDHITGLTGLGSGATVTISKAGGSFATPSGAISEIADGWYQVAANATDTNTLGSIALHATGTGADPCDMLVADVVAFDPTNANLGLTDVSANVAQWNGTAVSTPATAGIPDVNVKNINNVSASSVTTVNANIGETQPINFTGTGSSAFVKSDMQDIAGAAVSVTTAQIGTNVVHYAGQTAVVDANNLPEVGVQAINGATLAAQALAQSTQSICWGTCSGGTTTTAVVSALHNPTSLTASGQLIGRTIIFLGTTTSGGLQSQASTITASTTGSTPTLTFTAMTTAPASGDVFVVL